MFQARSPVAARWWLVVNLSCHTGACQIARPSTQGRNWVLNQLESNEIGAVGAVREPATSWRELWHTLTVTDFVQDFDLHDSTSLDLVCVEGCCPGLG